MFLGIASDLPEDPVVLHRFASRIVGMMSDPEIELPEPVVKGGSVDPPGLVDDLEPPLRLLEGALRQLEPQKRRTQLALKDKHEALKLARYAGGRVARYLEALCYLAGMDFHAQRVRLSSHVKVLEATAEEAKPTEEAPGGEGAEDATTAESAAGESEGSPPTSGEPTPDETAEKAAQAGEEPEAAEGEQAQAP